MTHFAGQWVVLTAIAPLHSKRTSMYEIAPVNGSSFHRLRHYNCPVDRILAVIDCSFTAARI